jgi:GNAT superfamily N-acetyltransferase
VAYRVERFGPGSRDDFRRLHSDANGAGWCQCVAWWVPTWDGWADRSTVENVTLRERLCEAGEYDGLLAFDGDVPVGWCQLGPRDRLEKLVRQFQLKPDPGAWAVSCFLVAPSHRGRGVAGALLAAAIEAAGSERADRLEGYPRRGESDPEGLWTGPEALFRAAGFRVVREGDPRSVLALELPSPAV